jgi:hypothetical protein
LSVLSACLHAFLLSETYERACVLGLVLHRGSEGATVIAANTGSVVDPRLLDSGYAVSKLVYGMQINLSRLETECFSILLDYRPDNNISTQPTVEMKVERKLFNFFMKKQKRNENMKTKTEICGTETEFFWRMWKQKWNGVFRRNRCGNGSFYFRLIRNFCFMVVQV